MLAKCTLPPKVAAPPTPIPVVPPSPSPSPVPVNILQQWADQLFAEIDAGLVGHSILLGFADEFQVMVNSLLGTINPSIAALQPFIDGMFSVFETWASGNSALKAWLVTEQASVDSFFLANGGRAVIITKA